MSISCKTFSQPTRLLYCAQFLEDILVLAKFDLLLLVGLLQDVFLLFLEVLYPIVQLL